VIDNRKYTVIAKNNIETWLEVTGVEACLCLEDIEKLITVVEKALRSGFEDGYQYGIAQGKAEKESGGEE
jgi:hypothetical protein